MYNTANLKHIHVNTSCKDFKKVNIISISIHMCAHIYTHVYTNAYINAHIHVCTVFS